MPIKSKASCKLCLRRFRPFKKREAPRILFVGTSVFFMETISHSLSLGEAHSAVTRA